MLFVVYLDFNPSILFILSLTDVGMNYLKPEEGRVIGAKLSDALKTNSSVYRLDVSENEFGQKNEDSIRLCSHLLTYGGLCLFSLIPIHFTFRNARKQKLSLPSKNGRNATA